mgnify:FL=1
MKKKFLRCPICGNLVEVINDSNVPIMCCGKPMEELVANTTDGATEKHVPVVEINNELVTITVGETLHPMTEEHYIMWIHVFTNLKEYHFNLNPSDNPQVKFSKDINEEIIEVNAYCNLHGLWSTN